MDADTIQQALTLAIPDRLGNHRGDTFFNVLETLSVGIVFIVPKSPSGKFGFMARHLQQVA